MSDTKTIEGVTDAINREAVQARTAGEPAWLASRRMHAWEVYEDTPMPTTRLEEWRYTDLTEKLLLDSLHLGSVEARPDDPSTFPAGLRQAMDEDREASGHLVLIDGAVVHTDIREDLSGKGVILCSLREAVEKHPELVEKHLATAAVPPEEGKFQALNAALWTDGVFFYVPRGVRLDLPVRVTRWISESGAAFFSRTLIVAEPTSQVSYVDEILSDDLAAQTLTSSAVEVITQDGAQVQYVAVQRMGRNAFYLSQQRTLAYRDSTLDTLNVNLGGSVTRVDLNARLMGPGANSDMLGLYFGDADQHFDHNTSQDHVAGRRDPRPRGRPANGRLPDQPEPAPFGRGSGRLAAQPRDRGRRREVLPRCHRGPAGRRVPVLPHEPGVAPGQGRAPRGAGLPG
jgi:Fe-S cluster assembly protein SufD